MRLVLQQTQSQNRHLTICIDMCSGHLVFSLATVLLFYNIEGTSVESCLNTSVFTSTVQYEACAEEEQSKYTSA